VNKMALKFVPQIEDIVEDLGVTGIAAIVLLPVLVPVAAGVGKPLAKATIKGGILLYEKGKGVIAEVGETLEDIVAEAKAELAEAQTQEAVEPAAS
jgi:phosphohistidine swiveling domain-containing protein